MDDTLVAAEPSTGSTPNGSLSLTTAPKAPSPKEKKTASSDEHIVEVIGPNGVVHQGNIEVHVSSSEQIMDPIPPSQTGEVANTVTEANKKHANVLTRSLWTFVMIGGFIGIFILS